MNGLGNIRTRFKDGGERFFDPETHEMDFYLLDFWKWCMSDLISNATRGILAEFIVAKGLDIDTKIPRNEWDPFDLTTPEGIKVEVKSAAYIQSWYQKDFSRISFSIRKTVSWEEETSKFGTERKRHADIYIYCLLHHKDQVTINPMDLSQWSFYVLSRKDLDNYTRSQHSITLRSLERISGGPVNYHELSERVEVKHHDNK